jgi:hypothetical protein
MGRCARLFTTVAALAVAITWGGTAATTSSTAGPDCPALTGTGAYETSLSPSSGPPGSTVTVSGALPDSTEVLVYWNLDFDRWSSLFSSPVPEVAGSRVQRLGTRDVSNLCTYEAQVTIPAVPPGAYPIEVLYKWAPGYPDGSGWGMASFAPTDFQVTEG